MTRAAVSVDGEVVGRISRGLVVLVGVGVGDGEADAAYLAERTAHLRIFNDASGKFNLSLRDVGGEALVVSQFTLLADTRKGRRPSFTNAAPPEAASALIDRYADLLRDLGVSVATGRFQAHMVVELENDGPVTIILDTAQRLAQRRG